MTRSDPPRILPPSGLDLLRAEMARQHRDGRDSLSAAAGAARGIADSLGETERLVLLGMGASHWINRVAEPLYRRAGIDATALVLSEYLRAPIVARPKTVILTSQSGASGEILRYMAETPASRHAFGLTLDPGSPLATGIGGLVGTGGGELGFAATRSLVVTLCLHAAILGHLGQPTDALDQALAMTFVPETSAAVAALAWCTAAVISSRGLLQGVADTAALTFMELGRLPVLALEGGQLKHGPTEILGPGVAAILIRPCPDEGQAMARLAETCLKAGSPTLVMDLSPEADIAGAVTVRLPQAQDLAAAVLALTALQAVIVEASAARVERVGEPIRSSKVTDGE
jgi:fructoselysine-6-P-deglycase FrlB-like protein